MPSALVMSSSTRLTKRFSRTMRATSPTSGRSSSPTHAGALEPGRAGARPASGGETEPFEPITVDRVAADELGRLRRVHARLGAEAPRDVEGVRPGAVRVRIVGFEEDL